MERETRIHHQVVAAQETLRTNINALVESGDISKEIPLGVVRDKLEVLGYNTRTMESITLQLASSRGITKKIPEIRAQLFASHSHGMNSSYDIAFRLAAVSFSYYYFDINDKKIPKKRVNRRHAKLEEIQLLNTALDYVIKKRLF